VNFILEDIILIYKTIFKNKCYIIRVIEFEEINRGITGKKFIFHVQKFAAFIFNFRNASRNPTGLYIFSIFQNYARKCKNVVQLLS